MLSSCEHCAQTCVCPLPPSPSFPNSLTFPPAFPPHSPSFRFSRSPAARLRWLRHQLLQRLWDGNRTTQKLLGAKGIATRSKDSTIEARGLTRSKGATNGAPRTLQTKLREPKKGEVRPPEAAWFGRVEEKAVYKWRSTQEHWMNKHLGKTQVQQTTTSSNGPKWNGGFCFAQHTVLLSLIVLGGWPGTTSSYFLHSW